VESWHRTLKKVYLKNLRTQRVDVLVHVLFEMVIPDYMADYVKTGALFQSGTLTAAEKRRRKIANDIPGKITAPNRTNCLLC
jgi:hypothetical protein